MAWNIFCACCGNVDTSFEAFSLRRAPRGGALAFEPATCEAGYTYPFEPRSVTRNAWRIGPAPVASSYRTRPGRIASPAASALVHPSGRRALLSSENTAPEPAVHVHDGEFAGRQRVFHVSKRKRLSLSTISMCLSPRQGEPTGDESQSPG